MSWVAVADESIRIEHGVYVFASCAVDEDDEDDEPAATELMRTLEPRPGRRFHWRDKEPHERMAAAEAIATLSALHIVVIGGLHRLSPTGARPPEMPGSTALPPG